MKNDPSCRVEKAPQSKVLAAAIERKFVQDNHDTGTASPGSRVKFYLCADIIEEEDYQRRLEWQREMRIEEEQTPPVPGDNVRMRPRRRRKAKT